MMETQKKNIPVLRFPKFEGEWEEKRLEELFLEFKSGQGITSKEISKKGLYPVYGGNGLRGYTNRYTHDGFYLLIGRQGALCGNINRSYNKAFISEHAVACKANETSDNEWLAQRLDYFNLNRLSESSAQPGLSVSKLLRFKLIVPTLPEQQKIAAFLTAVDNKLKALRKKKALLEQYKKGVMQKIFSQELRFKKEHGKDFPEWEEKRGKDLFGSCSNKNHNGGLPVLSASQEHGMVYRDTNGIRIQSSLESIKSYKIVEKGDFVISLRSFQGGIEYSDLKGLCSPAYIVLKPKVKIDNLFFKFYFKKESFIERLSKTVVGIRDGKQISYEAFGGLKFSVPSLKEQTQIANFLSAIDKKIASVEEQIEKTGQWKKGLLQRMFV